MVILICSILFAITSAMDGGLDLAHEFEINSPCIFSSTSPTISLPGVTFNGKGAILNQCGNFGFNARSGDEFFAFNVGTYATGPFGATFDKCCTGGVQLFAATIFGGTFTMKGWDENDQLVDTVTVIPSGNAWTPITITGIVKRVEVSTAGRYWGLDDMTCYHQSEDCSTGCNSNVLGDQCSIDDDCPPCMRCCAGRGVCEYRPDFNVQAAKSIFFSFDNNDLHLPEPLNNIKPVSAVHVKDPIYSYISLIGLIAFIIINNIFIGFWCLSKKNTVQYAKCDVVVDE